MSRWFSGAWVFLFCLPGCSGGGEGPRPRIEVVPAAGPRLEIRLATSAWLEVLAPAFEVRQPGNASPLELGPGHAGARRVRFACEAGRIAFAGRSEAGPLTLSLAPDAVAAGLTWQVSWDGIASPKRYRGELILGVKDHNLEIACALTLEEYLPGVVGSEMSPGVVALEALKAQAVAARTFTLFGIDSRQDRSVASRFAADTSFQAYGGVDKEHPRALEAVQSTLGEVLTFKGRLFRAYYHSTCGGGTTSALEVFGDAAIPPLAGVACGDCADSRHARWTSTWTLEELTGALRPWTERNGLRIGVLEELLVTDKDPSGRARYVRVRHTEGAFDILSTRLRVILGARLENPVKSTAFTAIKTEQRFLLEGRGWGHGVGLCQAGAARRAQREDHRAVLLHYFPQSEIELAYTASKMSE